MEPPKSSDCTLVSGSNSLPSFTTHPPAQEDMFTSSPPPLNPDDDPTCCLRNCHQANFQNQQPRNCVSAQRSPSSCSVSDPMCPIAVATKCWWDSKQKSFPSSAIPVPSLGSFNASKWSYGCSCFCASLTNRWRVANSKSCTRRLFS